MRLIVLFLIATVSVFSQDFIPNSDQFQTYVIDKMRDNKVKRVDITAYETDAYFKTLSDKAKYVYSYDYDRNGMLVLADYYNISQDIRVETSFAYTEGGTLESIVSIQTEYGSSGNPFVTTTTWWATITNGRIEYITKYVSSGSDNNANSTVPNKYIFTYDANGTLLTILDSVTDKQSGVPNTLYEMNVRGDVLTKSSDNQVTNYFYDNKGNLFQEIMDINGSRYVTTYDYDMDGNLLSIGVDGSTDSFYWSAQNDAIGLPVNAYSTFTSKTDKSKIYEWNTYTYSFY